MKYQPPYGVTDPNASYINGNPAAGIEGSIPPAAAFEEPLRELANFITDSGLTPSDADLHQLAKATQSGRVNYGVDTGTQNAMVVTLIPSLVGAAYFPGLVARVKALHSNLNDATHTTFTLDAGSGPAPVVRSDGSFPLSNDVPAGAITTYVFDGTRWQISNFLGTGGTGGGANTFLVKIPYVVDTSGVPNTVVANFSPAITALNAGDPIMVKIANTNTLPTQITVNALPAKAIVRNDGNLTPLQQSDLPAGAIVFLLFDGTQFLIIAGACNFGVPSKILEFMSTQNWTVPNGVYRVRAKVWGGGGGGGGSQFGRPGSGGGGGGGYAERICQVAPGLVIAITVGAGAAGQAWGVGQGPSAGTSSFGGYCSATGGLCGADSAYSIGPVGGNPGTGSGGDINMTGGFGMSPLMMISPQPGGDGGDGAVGGTGGGANTGLASGSQTARTPGGGGEGSGNQFPGVGAFGAQGMVVVEF